MGATWKMQRTVNACLLVVIFLAVPALGASRKGESVVSLLESRASDVEVEERLREMESSGGEDWLAMLFEVFKESRRDVQENQKYWLKRLEERNKINDAIRDYMQELTEQAQKLNEKTKRADDEEEERARAIRKVEAGLQRLEARTLAVEGLPEPLRRELAAQAERERRLLAEARRVVRVKPKIPRSAPKKHLRPGPGPVDPAPEPVAPVVRDEDRFEPIP